MRICWIGGTSFLELVCGRGDEAMDGREMDKRANAYKDFVAIKLRRFAGAAISPSSGQNSSCAA